MNLGCQFELTQGAWGVVTRPFSHQTWPSQQSDGTVITLVKSGVNGLCMMLSALACLIMAVVTPILAAVDLIYAPIKGCLFPEKPGKLPISSKEFYEGKALDSEAIFSEILQWTDQQIKEDMSFLYWMFPTHYEAELEQNPYSDQMVQGFKRILNYYGLTLTGEPKITGSIPSDVTPLKQIAHSMNLHGHKDLSAALDQILQPEEEPSIEELLHGKQSLDAFA